MTRLLSILLIIIGASLPITTSMMSSARLAGQRVLVTGAGRGIGRALALICSRQGADVAILSRTKSELEETASLATVNSKDCPLMSLHVADVTNVSEVEDTIAAIVKKWGGIDVLINNAGTSQQPKGTLEALSADDLRSLLDLNVVGVHIVTSAVLRHSMLPAKNGKIINIGSRAGKVGYPTNSHYCASKFALEGLTAALAEELRDKGIQVNSYAPGLVNTRSFPKPEGRKGARNAESIEDGFFTMLEGGITGHYLHADELDEVREKGLEDSAALKPIREAVFLP
ncbi:hypothetical protein ACHAWT_001846 [Skeletonema menzelii]